MTPRVLHMLAPRAQKTTVKTTRWPLGPTVSLNSALRAFVETPIKIMHKTCLAPRAQKLAPRAHTKAGTLGPKSTSTAPRAHKLAPRAHTIHLINNMTTNMKLKKIPPYSLRCPTDEEGAPRRIGRGI